jgi:hypothetical protein
VCLVGGMISLMIFMMMPLYFALHESIKKACQLAGFLI